MKEFRSAMLASCAALTLLLTPSILTACKGDVPTPAIFASQSYPDALKANASDGKILLVKATAEWCPPCKMMNRETFTDQKVIDWINAHGVAIQLDTDDNPQLASELGVTSIPTMIVYKAGKEIARTTGGLSASELLLFLEGAAQKK